MKRFTVREILVILAILGVSTALLLQVIPKQEQNLVGGGRSLPSFEVGTPITLQEARTKAPFALMPVYLPEQNLSLRRVTGLPGILGLLHENDDLYGEIRLFYSDRPITILPMDPSAVQKYPAAAKLVVITSQEIGNVPDENWIYNFVAEWNQEAGEEIFVVTKIRGTMGIGVDLGHVNKFRDGSEEPAPANITWWEDNLRIEVSGMFSLEELLKIAESMKSLETF